MRTRIAVLLLFAVGSFGMGLYALAAPNLSAPSIISGPANPTNQTSATFTYTHNKNVSFQCSLDGSSFTSCGTTRPSTKVYPGPLTPGAHTFQVRAVSGAQTSPAASYPWTIDLTSPAVVSINRNAPSPTNAGSVSWKVTFTESVTGVGLDDFTLVNSGLLLPLITSVSGSGSVYTATASTGAAGSTGSMGLNLVDNDSIRDLAGNRLGGTGIGNGSFTGEVYTIDKLAPPKPVFTQVPPDPSPTANTTFAWTDSEAGVNFQCSKENGPWLACATPHSYSVPITTNQTHQFAVRAVDAAGNVSAAASYSWKLGDIDFIISGDLTELLYPGTWRSIAVSITNPNSYDINVSALSVAVSSSPAGCPASTNIEFVQSSISSSQPVTVPRNSTVTLALADRPQIRLKDLPMNQDVCKNGTFHLTYAGTAIH